MSLKDLLSRFRNRKNGPLICRPESHPETGVEGVPDFVEPLLGWRTWKIRTPFPGPDACPGLSSIILDKMWAPRRKFSAEHSFDLGARCRGLLDLACSCGIYAFNDPLEAFVYLMRIRDRLLGMSVEIAMGTVSLWGKVVECRLGYKAEYAYPHHIYLPASFARFLPAVSSRFGVGTGIYAFTTDDELSLAVAPASGYPETVTLHLKNSGSLKPRGFPYEAGLYDPGGFQGQKEQLPEAWPDFMFPASDAPEEPGDVCWPSG
ncbi:MAG TPA: hypothetical protein VFL79_14675 [Terriglobia bacterium]|nr:hypothetical protein [Terriglobia bacterium]